MKSSWRHLLWLLPAAALIVAFQQCAPFHSAELTADSTTGGGPGPLLPPTDDEISASQVAFSRLFDGTAMDRWYGVLKTKDLGVVSFGMTSSYGQGTGTEPDAILMKVDALGVRVFHYNIGAEANNDQFFGAVEQSDGSIVAAGLSRIQPPGALDQGLVVKVGASGAYQWAFRIGAPASNDIFFSSARFGDDSILVAGRTIPSATNLADAYIAKLNGATGALIFQKLISGAQNEYVSKALVLANGDILLVGQTSSYGAGGLDGWIARLDGTGALLWSKAVGGAQDDTFQSVVELANGDLVAVGSTLSYGTGGDALVAVFNGSTGALTRAMVFGGAMSDRAGTIARAADGGLLIGGSTASYGTADTFSNALLFKMNAAATSVAWSRVYGGPGTDSVTEIAELADRRIAVPVFSSIDGTDAKTRTSVSVFKANGESSGTCMISGTIGLAGAAAAPTVTDAPMTVSNGTFTVETLTSTIMHDLSASTLGLCQ